MEKDVAAQIARKALRVLETDGWCKMALTWTAVCGKAYAEGSHCIAGAWNIALRHNENWVGDYRLYEPLVNAIKAQYPEFGNLAGTRLRGDEGDYDTYIAWWNNHQDRTRAEVTAILEKIAAC